MKWIKTYEQLLDRSEYYYISDLKTQLNTKKIVMSKSIIGLIVSFLEEKGFVKMKYLKKNSDKYFKTNSYEILEKQIYLHLSNHRGTINIMEDNDEWFYVNKTTYRTEYYKADQLDGLLKLLEELI